MNTLTIYFIPCTPAPANGYRLTWRVAGSGDPYTDEGLFTENPIVFTDSLNPEGTCYEGFLQSDCSESGESGSLLGNAIPWQTPCDESESGEFDYTIELEGTCHPGHPYSTYLINEGTPGDVIKVRASFSGTIIKTGGLFTRANLVISSPDGTSDSTETPCETDAFYHPFAITADTDITMVGTTAIVNLTAAVYNSTGGTEIVVVSIIEINGTPVNIQVPGCSGLIETDEPC